MLKANDELKGPMAGAAQATVLKLRTATNNILFLLGMPVPLPYFHALTMLQNNRDCLDALVTQMETASDVGECIRTLEGAAARGRGATSD